MGGTHQARSCVKRNMRSLLSLRFRRLNVVLAFETKRHFRNRTNPAAGEVCSFSTVRNNGVSPHLPRTLGQEMAITKIRMRPSESGLHYRKTHRPDALQYAQ